MKTLKQPSREVPDSCKSEALKNAAKGTAKTRGPHRQAQIASCARYETFMQKLAADFQRFLIAGLE